jgi:hypothetical protein
MARLCGTLALAWAQAMDNSMVLQGGEWVAVTEFGNHHVSVFRSADGSFLHRWGSEGSDDNQFNYPMLLCWSESHGVPVVPDSFNHRVLGEPAAGRHDTTR